MSFYNDNKNKNNKDYDPDYDPDDIKDLDSSWLDEFDKIENEYKNYYCEPLEFIHLNCLYLNNENEITYIHEEKVIFNSPGLLSREEIIGLIKGNSLLNELKYALLSILVFNINIEPENLKTFFRSSNQSGSSFLNSVKNIDSITFDKSISMFHDINNLYFIFYEKEHSVNKKHTVTKKIAINTGSLYNNNGNGSSNKNGNKKTKRKRYKDKMI
jgi:hypothetical protein